MIKVKQMKVVCNWVPTIILIFLQFSFYRLDKYCVAIFFLQIQQTFTDFKM